VTVTGTSLGVKVKNRRYSQNEASGSFSEGSAELIAVTERVRTAALPIWEMRRFATRRHIGATSWSRAWSHQNDRPKRCLLSLGPVRRMRRADRWHSATNSRVRLTQAIDLERSPSFLYLFLHLSVAVETRTLGAQRQSDSSSQMEKKPVWVGP
jgi:hypothetical protein